MVKRFTKHAPEQIVRKLEKERQLVPGATLAQILAELDISGATLNRWKAGYGTMNRSEARELARLRKENADLERMLGQAELEKAALKELAEGNFWARPRARTPCGIWWSGWAAPNGRLAGLRDSRDRHAGEGASLSDVPTSVPTGGHGRASSPGPIAGGDTAGPGPSPEPGASRRAGEPSGACGARRGCGPGRAGDTSAIPGVARDARWPPGVFPTMCGLSIPRFGSTWHGKAIKICNVLDEHAREHAAFRVDSAIGAKKVVELLDAAAIGRGGRARAIRMDNGPEFIAKELAQWAQEEETVQAFIPPGQPWRNGFVESFHNRARDELLADNHIAPGFWSANGRSDTMKCIRTHRWATSPHVNTRKNGDRKTRSTLKPTGPKTQTTPPQTSPHAANPCGCHRRPGLRTWCLSRLRPGGLDRGFA